MAIAISQLTTDSARIDLGIAKPGERYPPISRRALLHTASRWRGWVTLQHPYELADTDSALEAHADWPGPVKLVSANDNGKPAVLRRLEFYVARSAEAEMTDGLFDNELDEYRQHLHMGLSRCIVAWHLQKAVGDWQAPDPVKLATWLRDSGREAVVDEKDHVRFTIHRPGGTGQVRAVRETGQLRFTLPLGHWRQLSDEATAAIKELASQANRRTRLARIVWKSDSEKGCVCEAQIDMSGTPWEEPASCCLTEFWKTLLGCVARCLEAIFHQTAAEFTALADPRNHELARALIAVARS